MVFISLKRWTMSSLTLKGKASEQAPVASANVNSPLVSTTSSSGSVMDAPDAIPNHASPYENPGISSTDQPAPLSPTSSADGWGELDNGILNEGHDSDKERWDDVDPFEEQKPPPALTNIQAAQKRPVSIPKPHASGVRSKSVASLPSIEDEDLWGSIAAPAPRTASKPLNLKPATAPNDDDPWAAIAAPPPTTTARPLSLGRGRGAKAPAPKLGAQRMKRTTSTGGL